MGLLEARYMARAIAPHTSTDDVTPVLTGAVIGGEFGQYAFATDRYTVGRYDLTGLLDSDEPERVFIPRQVLVFVSSVGNGWLPEHLGHYHVEFEHVADSGTRGRAVVRFWYRPDENTNDLHLMRTWRTLGSEYNYPPVARLLERFLPLQASGNIVGVDARTHVAGKQVDKFSGYSRWSGDLMRITLPAASDNANKPQPTLIEVGRRFKGLIQPNLVFAGESAFGSDLAYNNLAADLEAKRNAASAKTKAGQESDPETQD
jgi:hypothetical protein